MPMLGGPMLLLTFLTTLVFAAPSHDPKALIPFVEGSAACNGVTADNRNNPLTASDGQYMYHALTIGAGNLYIWFEPMNQPTPPIAHGKPLKGSITDDGADGVVDQAGASAKSASRALGPDLGYTTRGTVRGAEHAAMWQQFYVQATTTLLASCRTR